MPQHIADTIKTSFCGPGPGHGDHVSGFGFALRQGQPFQAQSEIPRDFSNAFPARVPTECMGNIPLSSLDPYQLFIACVLSTNQPTRACILQDSTLIIVRLDCHGHSAVCACNMIYQAPNDEQRQMHTLR